MTTACATLADITIKAGIRPRHRLAAAALWWRGMGRQVLPHAGARAGIRWSLRALRPAAGLCAHDVAGRLIGLAGLRDGSGGLIRWDEPMRPALGPISGGLGRAGLTLWRGGPPTADLVLDGLVVHPSALRRGVARALIRAALAEATRRHRPGLRIEVLAANHPARALYASEGFVQVARHRMGHGRQALILRHPC